MFLRVSCDSWAGAIQDGTMRGSMPSVGLNAAGSEVGLRTGAYWLTKSDGKEEEGIKVSITTRSLSGYRKCPRSLLPPVIMNHPVAMLTAYTSAAPVDTH